MKKLFTYLLLVFLPGTCNKKPVHTTDNLIISKYGYVVYNSIADRQKYFIPLTQKAQNATAPLKNICSDSLDVGFYFLSNDRLDLDLVTIPSDTVLNEVYDINFKKFLGKSIITPVKIICEIDTVLNKSFFRDTIRIGSGANRISFVVLGPSVDVLKFSRIVR